MKGVYQLEIKADISDETLESIKTLNAELEKTNALLRERNELIESVRPTLEAQEITCSEYVGATKEDILTSEARILDQIKRLILR